MFVSYIIERKTPGKFTLCLETVNSPIKENTGTGLCSQELEYFKDAVCFEGLSVLQVRRYHNTFLLPEVPGSPSSLIGARTWLSRAEPVTGADLNQFFHLIQLLNRSEETRLDLRPSDKPLMSVEVQDPLPSLPAF